MSLGLQKCLVQMSPWHTASDRQVPRNLPLKVGLNWGSNSCDIADMDKCCEVKVSPYCTTSPNHHISLRQAVMGCTGSRGWADKLGPG